MTARNVEKYALLAYEVGRRRDGKDESGKPKWVLVNRRTGRAIRVSKEDGHCAITLPNGKMVRFQAKSMLEALAARPEPVGKPPNLAAYDRIRHRFRVDEGGVLVNIRTGKPPAVRADGQCRIEVDGKAVCFSPAAMLELFARDGQIEAYRRKMEEQARAAEDQRAWDRA